MTAETTSAPAADQPATDQAASVAQRAAWVQVARAILNLHEVITRS